MAGEAGRGFGGCYLRVAFSLYVPVVGDFCCSVVVFGSCGGFLVGGVKARKLILRAFKYLTGLKEGFENMAHSKIPLFCALGLNYLSVSWFGIRRCKACI